MIVVCFVLYSVVFGFHGVLFFVCVLYYSLHHLVELPLFSIDGRGYVLHCVG